VNYYPHHIGDYLRDTAHLSALEDGIYRRMLDLYYANEKPLGLDFDWLCKLLRLREDSERAAAEFVLEHFFQKFKDGWHNKRADEEIKIAARKAKAAKANGKKGGRPKKQQVSRGLANKNPDITGSFRAANPTESSQNQNQIQNQSIKSIVGQKTPDRLRLEAGVVLAYLNEQAGRDYRPVNGNISLIAARLKEGATVEDCKAVIDRKVKEWSGGEMDKFLRPATLFNAMKFAQYQGESAPKPSGEVI